ncbi:uncharacterized protein LOC135491988 [Lineus longissimus]|uniref:uncharacterized protein LOC135491988 n=1 Tax=Lineus longissimus TaxID=88925 RepID=UPI00315CE4A7
MFDDTRLDVPADLVRDAKNNLRYKFPLLLVVGALQDAGRILYVATNASAKNADVHIKAQDLLFDFVKICDGFILVSTNFKTGAKDIVEALHIAYLYLIDGVPDMAFTKMDSLKTTLGGMLKRVGHVSALLSQTKIKFRQARAITSPPQKQMTRTLELCLQTLDAAKSQVDLIEEYCRDLAPEVELWLRECQEVAQPQMARNRQDAERLRQEDQKKYWKELINQPDVKLYLARWRALSLLCSENHPTLVRTRHTIDSYYTSNPMPNEAIKQAWRDAEELPIANARWKALLAKQDLPHLVEPEIPDEPPELIAPPDMTVVQVTPEQAEPEIQDELPEPTDTPDITVDPLRRSGGSTSLRKTVTGAVSRLIDMSTRLNGIDSHFCGIFCGLKKNPHNKRIRRLQKNMRSLTGKLPKEMQPKSPPFHGIFERLNKDFGISLERSSGEVKKRLRNYSDSVSELKEVEVKPLAKALKKLDKSVGNLLGDMNHVLEKLNRDLADEPKYRTENWKEDRVEMETMRKTLREAIKVVEAWMKQIKRCTELMPKAKKATEKKNVDIHAIIRNCRELKTMLVQEMG